MTLPIEILESAHKASIFNRAKVEASTVCACFDCLEAFPPGWVVDWIEEKTGNHPTARCPRCANDTVLGDASGYPITDPIFMAAMNRRWCSEESYDASN